MTPAANAKQSHPKPGEIWVWGGFGTRIFNLLTQEGDIGHGGRPGRASLPHVHHALRHLQQELEKGEITSLAIPKLATGVGGLEWAEVKPLVEEHLGHLKIPVFVYTEYHKDVQADEPGL